MPINRIDRWFELVTIQRGAGFIDFRTSRIGIWRVKKWALSEFEQARCDRG